jgi:hypothetical protein
MRARTLAGSLRTLNSFAARPRLCKDKIMIGHRQSFTQFSSPSSRLNDQPMQNPASGAKASRFEEQ